MTPMPGIVECRAINCNTWVTVGGLERDETPLGIPASRVLGKGKRGYFCPYHAEVLRALRPRIERAAKRS